MFLGVIALPLVASVVMARVEVPIEAVPFILVGAAGVWILRTGYSLFVWLRTKPPAAASGPKRRWLIGETLLGTLLGSKNTAPMDVDVTVFAPPIAPPRDEVLVQVIFHSPEKEIEALSRATKADVAAQPLGSVPLTIPLTPADCIKATLECTNVVIKEPVQTFNWNGRIVCLYFIMQLPDTKVEIALRPILRVFVNGVPAGQVFFRLTVSPNALDYPPTLSQDEAKPFRRPFLSYASEDRVHVLKAAQLLGALRMKYFQDVLQLSPGDRWESRLYTEIENCDVFLLFWSQNARKSEWVIKEAEFALNSSKQSHRQSPLEIVPVLLEGPPPPMPPPSLREIHFNDPIRHVIFAEEIMANRRTPDNG